MANCNWEVIRNDRIWSTGEIKRGTIGDNDCNDVVVLFWEKVVKRVNVEKWKWIMAINKIRSKRFESENSKLFSNMRDAQ